MKTIISSSNVIVLCALLLNGCAQLTHGQAAGPATVADAEHHLLKAECNGYANEIDVCYQAAAQACPSGYSIIEWTRNYGSVARSIIFKCN